MIDPNTDMNEIIPKLWVGSLTACKVARANGFHTICVLESHPCGTECFHRPILGQKMRVAPNGTSLRTVESELLKLAHEQIRSSMKYGPVLVHCAAGVERSPLTVATFLTTIPELRLGLHQAYFWVTHRRPVTEDRQVCMATYSLELTESIDSAPPMQWRGSDDALQWTEWRPLHRIEQKVPAFLFYQGRILIDGVWHVSPIGWD